MLPASFTTKTPYYIGSNPLVSPAIDYPIFEATRNKGYKIQWKNTAKKTVVIYSEKLNFSFNNITKSNNKHEISLPPTFTVTSIEGIQYTFKQVTVLDKIDVIQDKFEEFDD